eukprot:8203512-Pyramimonas_sp.AAC.1
MRSLEARKTFLEKATQALDDCSQQLQEAFRSGKPDAYFDTFTRVLQDQAADVFGGSLTRSSDTYRQHAEERRLLLQRRIELRERLAETGTDWEEEEVKEALRMLSKECSTLRRRQYRTWRKEVTDELDEAWRVRNLKEAHRLIRLLACRGRAPRGRNFRHLQGASLTADDWMSVWAQAGPLGGMMVEEVDEAELTHEVGTEGYYGVFTVEAKTDFASISRYLRRAPKRRSCPPWT